MILNKFEDKDSVQYSFIDIKKDKIKSGWYITFNKDNKTIINNLDRKFLENIEVVNKNYWLFKELFEVHL